MQRRWNARIRRARCRKFGPDCARCLKKKQGLLVKQRASQSSLVFSSDFRVLRQNVVIMLGLR